MTSAYSDFKKLRSALLETEGIEDIEDARAHVDGAMTVLFEENVEGFNEAADIFDKAAESNITVDRYENMTREGDSQVKLLVVTDGL